MRINNSRIWKYWVSREMARDIIDECSLKELGAYGWTDNLTQILKKEWFR